MTITKTFTEGADSFLVHIDESYELDFAGGNDRLVIRAGTTIAQLGAGDDYVRVEGGLATLSGDAGADRFDLRGGSVTANGGADNDRFNIWGGSNHHLDGGAGDDLFVSYGAADGLQLSGGEGNDRFYGFSNDGGLQVTLSGGVGNDLYRVLSNSGPTIIELAGEGTDTVQVARGVSYTLGANLENLRVVDTLGAGEDATLTGNGLRNLITGSSGRDTIQGMGGNDTLVGGAGNDTIDGGDGNDRITGGLGGDTMAGGAGSDLFVYSSVNDSPYAGGSYAEEDFITDWTALDHIDLSAVDANSLLPGQQHFNFAGYSFGLPPATHEAGSLWIGGFGGELWIIGFTDNDTTPDFLINLWAPQDEGSLKIDNLTL
jgi:Ca2+-binding RTX toxin-like protein